MLDACRTVEVKRAGRGCDEDRQATLDQVMEEEKEEEEEEEEEAVR